MPGLQAEVPWPGDDLTCLASSPAPVPGNGRPFLILEGWGTVYLPEEQDVGNYTDRIQCFVV